MKYDAVLGVLQQCARRHSRVDHEADDLVQDVLILAISGGRRLADENFVAWAKGVIRNHARFVARSAIRRRARETAWASIDAGWDTVPRFAHEFTSLLPPAQRVVALLVNLGLTRAEIRHLLGLSDVAFRQRLSGLRRAFQAYGSQAELCRGYLPISGDGLARRALKGAFNSADARSFAIRDPDGIPLFFSKRAHIQSDGGN